MCMYICMCMLFVYDCMNTIVNNSLEKVFFVIKTVAIKQKQK